VFFPLWLLSYTSILGIISTLLTIGVVLIDGLTKKEAPGSLWSPAETSIGIASLGELGVAFGLFMAGFSGHAVLPSLARDMTDPNQFDTMINYAFGIATVIYSVIGAAGYFMFGDAVSDEVSQDLMRTPGYNTFLNRLVLWSLVLMPLTKFALSTRPVNINLEILLGLDKQSSQASSEHSTATAPGPSEHTGLHLVNKRRPTPIRGALVVVERTVFVCLSVAVSILIPEFSSMMAFLGSFSAFVLCVIGPISVKMALTGRWSFGDAALLVMGVVMATWGTIAAFAA